MGTMLWQLWTDPVYFRYCVKASLSMVGSLIGTGIIPTNGPYWKVGMIAMALAQAIPAARPPTSAP